MLSTSTGEQARLLLNSDFASCLKFCQTKAAVSGLLFSRHSHSSGMRKVPEAVSKEYLP